MKGRSFNPIVTNPPKKKNAPLYKTIFFGVILCFLALVGSAMINGNDESLIASHVPVGVTPALDPTASDGDDTNPNSGTTISTKQPVLPVADFWSDTTSGEAPLKVQFFDGSTGSPTSGNWNFGDGVTSTKQSPIHTYTTAGTYTVTETVTNAAGKDAEIKTDYITVTAPLQIPDADFSASKTSGEAPLTVSFTDDSSGSPNTWQWNFGDSSDTLTEYNPTHTYTTAGTYTVTETVTNAAGKDTETKTNYITATAPKSNGPASDYTSYPTKSEVLTFVNKYQGRSDFIETVSEASGSDHPEWKWDIWRDQSGNKFISFYHDENNPNGYDSIYFDNKGIENSNPKTVSPPIESHKGA
ncbi:PKD domain-containing protein [Methanosarcina sp. UBA5]|uniref:PKD domain-containing protein n=1 Tax=Methanosarcina sp. UBA5 TaxID=1915593 RepID=UPI0025CBF4D7|nr:PKD domain-containing protein [Methanosarcina sp. UBA5]